MVHKLSIAQKECKETIYWLKVLYGSEYIEKEKYDELMGDVEELYRVLTASIKTAKGNMG
jgi:four helix bundle protein